MEYKRVRIDYVAGQEAIILVNYLLKNDLVREGKRKGIYYENISFNEFKIKLVKDKDELVWLIKLIDGDYEYTSYEKSIFNKNKIKSNGKFNEQDNIVCLVYVDNSDYIYLNHENYDYLKDTDYEEFKYYTKYYDYSKRKKNNIEVEKHSNKLKDILFDWVEDD